ncbi:MAG: BREX-1 system adenine-specific DNA-methyltransferase PglX [Marinomonas sp.]
MNTSNLKAYAPKARRDFIAAITKQAQKYGVTKGTIYPVQINGDVCVVNGKPFPANMAPRIRRLAERVERLGFEQTMEQVAYSWFNRLIAIRYMELHDYLGHGRRVLSHPDDSNGLDAQGRANGAGSRMLRVPQILEECTDLSYGNDGDAGQLPYLSHEKVVDLKLDGTKDEELYRELLLAQCHALHNAMPFLFERVDDETELLLPENLTKTDSLIHDLITDLAESDWDSIEVVGWLYQFYISEKKDQVIGKVVKTEDIPAATQLFTPNWIVKYMVQNSLGAQWLATYPDSPLKAQMEYYIEPAEQTDAVNAQLKEITPTELNPEELTLIDPASGSGHILVEAYDLFKAIYLERGYRQRDIAQLILENNLFGLDIDQRAAQLTGFALMMKGREDDRRLFERGVKLNVMAMGNSTSLDVNTLVHGIDLSQYGLTEEDLTALKELFEHVTTFGSLIQVPQKLAEKLPALKQLSETNSQDMFVKEVLESLAPLVMQAEILAAQYDEVVANPPYIGNGGMNALVKRFVKDFFPDSKSDLFACFIDRSLSFAKGSGRIGVVAPYVWMFISSYEKLRLKVIGEAGLTSLIQLEYNAFEPACIPVATFSLTRSRIHNFVGSYINLSDFKGHQIQAPRTLEAISNPECGWLFHAKSGDFTKIPGSPIAYWVANATRELFQKTESVGHCAERVTKGIFTGNNDLFLRFWHETSASNDNWRLYSKGGAYRKWYGNTAHVVRWDKGDGLLHQYSGAGLGPSKFYDKPHFVWSKLTSADASFRHDNDRVFFDDCSPAVVLKDVDYALLAVLNTNISARLLKIINPTLNYQSGNIHVLPVMKLTDEAENELLATNAEECVDYTRCDWDSYECSWQFFSHPLLTSCSGSKFPTTIESSYISWFTRNSHAILELKRIEEENNSIIINAYGLQDEFSSDVPVEKITLTVNPAYRYGVKGTEEERNTRFREDTMEELISYAIGCMMGRYSLDAPGLIYANSGNEGFDALVEAGKYTTFPADDDGIIPLTDAEWFADDAANRVEEFISVAWPASSETGNHLEENLDFLAANLSPKKSESSRDTIRRYLCDKFYKDHLQTYKKRPIYWLFSSGKQKAFQCLVYLHRYNESTLARMRTEYVIPLTAKLSAHINKLDDDKLASGSAAEIKKLEKEIKRLQKQQTELTEFDEKLKHYADMRIPLDLDDGVKVNYGKFGDLLADVKAIHGKVAKVNL